MPEDIMIDCEGSGLAGHMTGAGGWLMCKMCGCFEQPDTNKRMPVHERRDVLAMIDRGDFDG